jgi:iron donor protein CyaY
MDTFHKRATQELEKVGDFFESSWPNAEVDLLDETLTVSMSNGEYVINKHGVTEQIWVASPFTGAHHFAFKEGEWRCTRTNISLNDLFLNELKTYAS